MAATQVGTVHLCPRVYNRARAPGHVETGLVMFWEKRRRDARACPENELIESALLVEGGRLWVGELGQTCGWVHSV